MPETAAGPGRTLGYIVVDYYPESGGKCTLKPLRGREDFSFRVRTDPGRFPDTSLLLYPDGEVLTPELGGDLWNDAGGPIGDGGPGGSPKMKLHLVIVDARWRRAPTILKILPPLRKISLRGFVTGAVRSRPPPEGGLASIEALFAASHILGVPDLSLLDDYHFRDRFLKKNGF